jgi:hypothetical protein
LRAHDAIPAFVFVCVCACVHAAAR